MAVLIVNGTFNYKNNLWLRLSVNNIIRYTSPHTKYKIIVWNHDYRNPEVTAYLNSVADYVEVLSAEDVDPGKWSIAKCDETNTRYDCFSGGYHSHRGALQILYEHVVGTYEADIIFTFDSDAWPIRNNWELPLIYRLDRDIKLAGVWRDELKVIIAPYVHPSCLGIKTETIKRFNLRFDEEPEAFKEDTLSHFTRIIKKHFGDSAIMPFKRSNMKEYHTVFNGIYGGLLYHHHLGTRYMDGNIGEAKTYGWQERGESPEYNKFILDGVTQRVFEHTDDFMDELAYGERAFNYKLYAAFLKNLNCHDAYHRLLEEARAVKSKDLFKTFYILGLISKYFAFDAEFLQFYADICRSLGYRSEAECYMSLVEQDHAFDKPGGNAEPRNYDSEQES